MKKLNFTISDDADDVLKEYQFINKINTQDEAIDLLLKEFKKLKEEKLNE